MAVNLIDSQDIKINQTDNDITLETDKTTLNTIIQGKIDEYTTYSTSEEILVGTWIDGKPLYRKTIVFPNGTGTTSLTTYDLIDYGISNIDDIFIVHPSFYSLGAKRYPFQYNDGSAFECNVNTTQLFITLGYGQIANSRFVITLEYTKTTD